MKAHRLDVFALCSGVLFLGLAVGFALDGLDVWDAEPAWIAPLLLIVLGLAGALSTLTRPAAESPETAEVPTPE